jgi:protoporphyrinogen oxidase
VTSDAGPRPGVGAGPDAAAGPGRGVSPGLAAAARRWAIVGGGMLGLTLAHRLAQRGRAVTVLEGAPVLGGLASAWSLGPVTWDRHYHVTLLSDSALRRVLDELGLEREIRWVRTRTGFYSGGRLHSMSDALEFLRFPLLGLVDKLRLGATIVRASRIRDWRALERVPVEDWLRRWSGDRTFENLWLPLLRSKLGEQYRETSAAFIWATIARLYAARRSGMKEERFGYVPGGYARVLERFGTGLKCEGVDVRLGWRTARVEAAPGRGVVVHREQGAPETFDAVVLTPAAPLAARLAPGLGDAERACLEGVRYQGIVCASLLLRRPLAGFYVTNITDAGLPFTGVIEMTALVEPAQFGGRTLVYLPRYAAPDDPLFARSDEDLRAEFTAGLRRMYPALGEGDVEAFQVSRVRHVFPLPTLGYSDRVPPMETSVPGLYVVNSSQIVNGTLNVNETVQLAERAVERLAGAGRPPGTAVPGRRVGPDERE